MFALRWTLIVLVLSLSPISAKAQTSDETTPLFDNYLSLRATLDSLVKARRISDLMRTFGDTEMSAEELTALEARVKSIYPNDFQTATLIHKNQMSSGWRQEMIGYWTGSDYIYVYLLLHQRDEGLLAVTMSFNSDFDEVYGRL